MDMSPDGGITKYESRSSRAFGTPMTARRIRNLACRPTCSYTLARPMSERLRKQTCPSTLPLSGTFIVNERNEVHIVFRKIKKGFYKKEDL